MSGNTLIGFGRRGVPKKAQIRVGLLEYDELTRPTISDEELRGQEILAVLPRGFAWFKPEEVTNILGYWEVFANQSEERTVPVPDVINRESIINWAREVLDVAYEDEPSGRGNSPRAYLYTNEEDGTVILSWDGYFTAGRYVYVTVIFSEDGEVINVCVEWDSATGRPSSYLGVEHILTLPGCDCFDH